MPPNIIFQMEQILQKSESNGDNFPKNPIGCPKFGHPNPTFDSDFCNNRSSKSMFFDGI